MKSSVARWPFAAEFLLVLAVAFGPFIVSAWQQMPYGRRSEVKFNDAVLLQTVVIEVVLAALLLGFLRLRGYTRADFPFNLRAREWFEGLWLMLLAYGTVIVVATLAVSILGVERFTEGTMITAITVSVPVALIASLVNALYEEVFVTGYIVTTLEKANGLATAVAVSVFVRFLYHVYQGPQAVYTVLPIGIIFALGFVQRRNLWPLVLAHAAIDIVTFIAASRQL